MKFTMKDGARGEKMILRCSCPEYIQHLFPERCCSNCIRSRFKEKIKIRAKIRRKSDSVDVDIARNRKKVSQTSEEFVILNHKSKVRQ